MSYNVLSKEGLVTWLERQPAETSYSYIDFKDCLGARYCHAHGLGYGSVEGFSVVSFLPRIDGNFREQLEYVAYGAHPRTYGGALELARTLP